jgi:hypothetical protein
MLAEESANATRNDSLAFRIKSLAVLVIIQSLLPEASLI